MRFGNEPLVGGLAQPVKSAFGREDCAESGYLVIHAALHGEVVALGYTAGKGLVHGDGFRASVHGENAQRAHAGDNGVIRLRHHVHDHAFGEVAHVVHGKGSFRCERIRGQSGQLAAAVAEEHSAQIEFGRFEKSFHFRIEQIDERAFAGQGRAHRLVGYLYPAVQVFEVEGEALVIVARRHGKRARFRTRADAAVQTVRDHFDYLLAPHVRGGLFDFCHKGIDSRVQLICHYAEIDGFKRLFRAGEIYHIISSFL